MPLGQDSDTQVSPTGRRVEEEGKSKCRSVMGRIGVEPVGNITQNGYDDPSGNSTPRRKPADFPRVGTLVTVQLTGVRQ